MVLSPLKNQAIPGTQPLTVGAPPFGDCHMTTCKGLGLLQAVINPHLDTGFSSSRLSVTCSQGQGGRRKLEQINKDLPLTSVPQKSLRTLTPPWPCHLPLKTSPISLSELTHSNQIYKVGLPAALTSKH